jgi:hypothetical protein
MLWHCRRRRHHLDTAPGQREAKGQVVEGDAKDGQDQVVDLRREGLEEGEQPRGEQEAAGLVVVVVVVVVFFGGRGGEGGWLNLSRVKDATLHNPPSRNTLYTTIRTKTKHARTGRIPTHTPLKSSSCPLPRAIRLCSPIKMATATSRERSMAKDPSSVRLVPGQRCDPSSVPRAAACLRGWSVAVMRGEEGWGGGSSSCVGFGGG